MGNGCSSRCTMAAVAEHVAVQKGVASLAAEPAGDEQATAGDAAGDGAGEVLVTTRRLSLVQSGARRTCRLR